MSKHRVADAEDRRVRMRQLTDEKIVGAVMQLIRTGGLDAVTMEAASALSGVAKTTLYRRYRDRYELLAGVSAHVAAPIHEALPAAVSAESLTRLARALQDTFSSQYGSAMAGHILASDQAFLATWRRRVVKPRIDALHDFFARGVLDGVLRADADYQLIIEFILGGAVACDALRGSLPPDWADGVVTCLWPLIADVPARSHGGTTLKHV